MSFTAMNLGPCGQVSPEDVPYRRRGVLCGGHCPFGMQMSVFSAAVHLHCSNETKLQFAAPLRP
jgi:hypothetical protein